MALGSSMLSSPGVGGVQQVDLVEDQQPRRRVSADLLEDRVHRRDRLAAPALGLGRVDDVDDEIGEDRLLERRLERLDELMRELADEADRVGDEVAPPAVPIGARSRVERVEEPLPHADTRARQRVQQRGLARVRVPGEGDGRERGAARGGLASTSRLRSSRARRRRRLAIRSRASRRSVSIWRLPGPARPDPAAQAAPGGSTGRACARGCTRAGPARPGAFPRRCGRGRRRCRGSPRCGRSRAPRAPPPGSAPDGAPARRRRRRGSRRSRRSRALSSASFPARGSGRGRAAGGPGPARRRWQRRPCAGAPSAPRADHRRGASVGTTEMASARWRARGFSTPAPPRMRVVAVRPWRVFCTHASVGRRSASARPRAPG